MMSITLITPTDIDFSITVHSARFSNCIIHLGSNIRINQ